MEWTRGNWFEAEMQIEMYGRIVTGDDLKPDLSRRLPRFLHHGAHDRRADAAERSVSRQLPGLGGDATAIASGFSVEPAAVRLRSSTGVD